MSGSPPIPLFASAPSTTEEALLRSELASWLLPLFPARLLRDLKALLIFPTGDGERLVSRLGGNRAADWLRAEMLLERESDPTDSGRLAAMVDVGDASSGTWFPSWP